MPADGPGGQGTSSPAPQTNDPGVRGSRRRFGRVTTDERTPMTDQPTVALLGTGTMGAGMARNIAAAGLPLRVWNRTPARAEPLADVAEVASSVAEAVAGRRRRADHALRRRQRRRDHGGGARAPGRGRGVAPAEHRRRSPAPTGWPRWPRTSGSPSSTRRCSARRSRPRTARWSCWPRGPSPCVTGSRRSSRPSAAGPSGSGRRAPGRASSSPPTPGCSPSSRGWPSRWR